MPQNNVYIPKTHIKAMRAAADAMKTIAFASIDMAKDKATPAEDAKEATRLAILNAAVAGMLIGLIAQAEKFDAENTKPAASNDNLTSLDV